MVLSCVSIFVSRTIFCFLRATGGPRTTGWEPLIYPKDIMVWPIDTQSTIPWNIQAFHEVSHDLRAHLHISFLCHNLFSDVQSYLFIDKVAFIYTLCCAWKKYIGSVCSLWPVICNRQERDADSLSCVVSAEIVARRGAAVAVAVAVAGHTATFVVWIKRYSMVRRPRCGARTASLPPPVWHFLQTRSQRYHDFR